jgi:NtrC-family two-component system sensor histidine kinase KinB
VSNDFLAIASLLCYYRLKKFSSQGVRPVKSSLELSAQQLHTLVEINRKIITIRNPEDLAHEAMALLQRGFGYEYVNLFFINAIDRQLVWQGGMWHGQPADLDEDWSLPLDEEGTLGWAAVHGQPALVSGMPRDARYRYPPQLSDVKSEVAVPIGVDGHILGVLSAQSDRAGILGEADQFVLQTVADQVAISLETARLRSTVARHLHQETVLYEIDAAIGANLDADTMLDMVAAKLAEAVAADGCVIYQWDAGSDKITAIAEHVASQIPSHTRRTLGRPTSLTDDPIARQVLHMHLPTFLHDKQTADRSAVWHSPGWGALLTLPLEVKERIIGLVEIYDQRSSREFTADEIQLCRALAHQTALAMERTRLFDETRRQLNEVSELYALAHDIAVSLDLTEVLDAIVQAIRRAMNCRGCCIFLLDEVSHMLTIKAAAGLKPHWRDMAQLHLGEGIVGRAAAEARTIYLPDTHQDTSYIFFDREVRSLLAVPLQVKGQVIGVINVDDRVADAFGPGQERLLTIAAAQAAITIENARLFSEILSEKQRTEAVIKHMADGLLVLDQHGVVLSCNPAIAMLLDMRQQDIVGRLAAAPDADPRLRAICVPVEAHGRPGTGTLAHDATVPRSGLPPRALRVFSTPVSDEDGQPLGEVRVVHDVTQEHEIEEMRDEFFSTISHDLRTPLSSIRGFVRLLLDNQVPDEGTQREFLGLIGQQTERLEQMVNNLLDISRLEAGKLTLRREPLQLATILREATSKLQGMARDKHVRLESDMPADLPTVAGDGGWLEQVATNLIGNAVKFTPAGGQITVSARRSAGEVVAEVRDTGIGVPADLLERIFDKYYRVPGASGEQVEGTGLGLHIAKRIVEAHGGRIWAESMLGQGSVFRFTLPCS